AGDTSQIIHSLADKKMGFIGAGRLARAMALALESIGLNVCLVASRSPNSAKLMAESFNSCRAVTPQELADQADLVFITTPDSAIETTVTEIKWRAGQSVVHCSG